MNRTLMSPGSLARRVNEQRAPEHRQLLEGDFWRRVPAYAHIDEETFLDHKFQSKNSVINGPKLRATLGTSVSEAFYDEVETGLSRASMSLRLSPYLIALIDWSEPEADPLRRQFLPLVREQRPDHPMARYDSLAERAHSPVPGLTHRYRDKALFLTQDRCPVYCRFCTRSYAVGMDTEELQKDHVASHLERWERVFEYLEQTDEVEDVVVSGGDSYSLRAEQIDLISDRLLALPNIRRVRFATKGPAVMPMKILTDEPWTRAIVRAAEIGRQRLKEVVIHTHFNHPNEITGITRDAMARLFSAGVTVRNQAVLLRGVNDDADTMRLLVKRLGHINVQPYYVFQHDLVQGVEDLRTTVATAIEIEKQVRGVTAGFQCPTFVVDTPGGGGKRDVHSFDYYDRVTGVSVYRSPNVDVDRRYLYFDPLDLLPPEGQERWADPSEHSRIIEQAAERASS